MKEGADELELLQQLLSKAPPYRIKLIVEKVHLTWEKEELVKAAAIEVSLERIRDIIAGFGIRQFSTAEVIKEYSGTFCSNTGTPAYYSFNAQFGKLLKRFDDELQIREVEKNKSVTDDHGHVTSCSYWESF